MSELNDYLEGKITFEEFEKRREERKAKNKVTDFILLVIWSAHMFTSVLCTVYYSVNVHEAFILDCDLGMNRCNASWCC